MPSKINGGRASADGQTVSFWISLSSADWQRGSVFTCINSIGVQWQVDREMVKKTVSIWSSAMDPCSHVGTGLFIYHKVQSSAFISNSNKAIICGNRRWETVKAIHKIYGCLLIVSETTFALKTNTKLLGHHCCSGHVYVEGFHWQQISSQFPSICSWNQGHVLLRPRLFNICVLGCALSESCYFCLGDRVGNEAKKRHSLQLSLRTAISPRLPPCKQGQACYG